MGWEVELFRALVDIVKAGGFYGIMGLLVWGILPIIKITSIMVISWLIARAILTRVCNLYLLRKYHKASSITLLSKQTSKHLEEAIVNWRKESERATKELLKSVEDLKQNSKDTTKKEPVTTSSSTASEIPNV